MSQIKLLITTLFAACLLAGCGDSNSSATPVSASGKHQANWISGHAAVARTGGAECLSCHGVATPGISGMSCMNQNGQQGCHVASPLENSANCLSCHGGTAGGPFGDSAPNRIGSHAKHTALAGVSCATCHEGGGFGSAGHGQAGVTVAIAATYKVYSAPGMAFGFSAGSCARISCHGGLPTKVWGEAGQMRAGVNSDCLVCHAPGPGQFNGYVSGFHDYHLDQTGADCTDCHNIYSLRNYATHFGGLQAGTLVAPGATVGGLPSLIGSYDTGVRSCNNVVCHSLVPRSNIHWIQGQ